MKEKERIEVIKGCQRWGEQIEKELIDCKNKNRQKERNGDTVGNKNKEREREREMKKQKYRHL